MKCPHCGADNDRVIDSRASHDGQAIRRRRECLACQTRYNTFERVDDPMRCPFCHEQSNRVVETLRRRRRIRHPPPPRMPRLPPALHHARTERRAEHQGREKRRRPRAVRPAEDQAGVGKSLLEAAGQRRAARADRLVDRDRSSRQVRGRSRKLLARRAADAAPAPGRPGGLRPLCQRLPRIPGRPRLCRRARADVGRKARRRPARADPCCSTRQPSRDDGGTQCVQQAAHECGMLAPSSRCRSPRLPIRCAPPRTG